MNREVQNAMAARKKFRQLLVNLGAISENTSLWEVILREIYEDLPVLPVSGDAGAEIPQQPSDEVTDTVYEDVSLSEKVSDDPTTPWLEQLAK